MGRKNKRAYYGKGNRIDCVCRTCSKLFKEYISRFKRGRGRYCCRKCQDIGYHKTHKHTLATRREQSRAKQVHPLKVDGYPARFVDKPHPKYNFVVQCHVYVMEKHIGRRLRKGEVVHHKKSIDDYRLQNLKLFKNQAEHAKYHSFFRKRTKTGLFI